MQGNLRQWVATGAFLSAMALSGGCDVSGCFDISDCVAGCGCEQCSSCGCDCEECGCGFGPIPGGFPASERIPNATQVRLAPSGIAFLEANLADIVEGALVNAPGVEVGRGLRFTVPAQTDVPVVGAVCATPDACNIDLDITSVSMDPLDAVAAACAPDPFDPGTLLPCPERLSLRVGMRVRSTDADGNARAMHILANNSGDPTCEVMFDTDWGSAPLTLELEVALVEEPSGPRAGYSRFDVVRGEFAGVGLEPADVADLVGCRPFRPVINDTIAGIFAELNGNELNQTLQALESVCQPALPNTTITSLRVVSALGTCVEVTDGGFVSGTNVSTGECSDSPAQQWSFEAGTLRNTLSACLQANGESSGSNVTIAACSGAANQRWALTGDTLRTPGGLCLDVQAANASPGANVQVFSCNGTAAQQWRFEEGPVLFCPEGSLPSTGGICFNDLDDDGRYDARESQDDSDFDPCIPLLLGAETRVRLDELLGSILPGIRAGIDVLIAAQGEGQAVGGGYTLPFFGGFESIDDSACVPELSDAQLAELGLLERPQVELSPSFSGDEDTAAAGEGDVQVGISEEVLNYGAYQVWRSGALCVEVTTRLDPLISTGLFSVLIRSLNELAFPAQSAALGIVLRPQRPPHFVIGAAGEPVLGIVFPKLALDFYVYSSERYVRFMTFTADFDIDVELSPDPDTGVVTPAIASIELSDTAVTNSELIREDPARVESAVQAVIPLAASMAAGALPSIDLASMLVDDRGAPLVPFGLKLASDSFRLVEDALGQRFLGIFVGLTAPSAPAPLRAPVDTRLTLAAVNVPNDTDAMELEAFGQGERPSLEFALSGAGPQDVALEYQYRVDHGAWSPWSSRAYHVVTDDALLLQGRHTLEARARTVGQAGSADRTPARVEFDIDILPPTLVVAPTVDGLRVSAADVVTPRGELQYRTRESGARVFSDWQIMEGGELQLAGRVADSVDIEVRDRAGNVARHVDGLRGLPAPTEGEGCQGCQAGDPSGAPHWWTLLALLLVAVRRRSAGAQAVSERVATVGPPTCPAPRPRGRPWRLWLLAAALGLLPSCGESGGEDPSLRPATLSSRRLTTSGTWLVDELGRKVILRGVNTGGRAKMPPFMPFDFEENRFEEANDAFFASVAALGSNVVRLMLSWEALEPTEGTRDMAYWARYVAMMDAAHAHGIGVIVDFHQDVYASPFCGDGFPVWTLGSLPHGEPRYDCQFFEWPLQYYDGGSSVNQAFERLWTNEDDVRTKLGAMWRFVARELRTHPAVVGFEPINEPGVGTGSREVLETVVLPGFYTEIGSIIEEEAGATAIFGGSTAGDSTVIHSLVRPALDHFVFAPHSYDALAFIGIQNANYERLRQGTLTSATWSGQDNAPTVIGEWGMPNANPAKGRYLDVLLDIYDEMNLSAIHWDAHVSATKWNNEDFTTFLPDGSEQSWAGSLDRPYPRAVSGEGVRFEFDREATRFSATITQAGAEVSEFYIPARRFGSAPLITVRGARYHYLPEDEILVVQARAGTDYSLDVGATP